MIDPLAFENNGFGLVPSVFSQSEVERLVELVTREGAPAAGRGGTRDVMAAVPALRAVADHPRVAMIVRQALGHNAFVVRATLFDKSPDSNWKVPWHQDVTVAVNERTDQAGYGPWSVKQGVVHVQPPSGILERMVTVRIHLDPCPAANGALRVMPGTHRLGKLNQNDVGQYVNEALAVVCEADAGEALVMRPLLLHASSPSTTPNHRRVLHFDYADSALAPGLEWKIRTLETAPISS